MTIVFARLTNRSTLLKNILVALTPAIFGALPAVAFPLTPENCQIECIETVCLGYDTRFAQDRAAWLQATDHSLTYLETAAATDAYGAYLLPGVTQERVQRSLVRFRQLVATSHSAQQLQRSVAQQFDFYRSVGADGAGRVAFTGYFEPPHEARAVPAAAYR